MQQLPLHLLLTSIAFLATVVIKPELDGWAPWKGLCTRLLGSATLGLVLGATVIFHALVPWALAQQEGTYQSFTRVVAQRMVIKTNGVVTGDYLVKDMSREACLVMAETIADGMREAQQTWSVMGGCVAAEREIEIGQLMEDLR